jgi:tetratricopeptide (TPR) repeat protein
MMAVLSLVLISVVILIGCGEKSAQAFFDRGARELQDGNSDEAIATYLKGLELEPGSAVGYNLLGMAYRTKYNTLRATEWKEKEIEAFRKAVASDSTYWPAQINLGATLYYLGSKGEAAVHFRRALELHPENPERELLEQFVREGGGEAPGSND